MHYYVMIGLRINSTIYATNINFIMGVFRGGPRPPSPNRPQKLPFYHDEGSAGGTSLAAMPSVLDTKAKRLNFVQ